jgi:tripartite-type tricarboxylate transporter receptor subunit TctC
MRISKLLAATILSTLSVVSAASAQSVADFYKGKTVSVIVSTGSGGGYDVLARAITRHLPKYIPGNPNMIVQNMPGGGHMLAANHVYNIAAKDGTVIAALNQNVPSNQLLTPQAARYQSDKFIWLGRFAEKGNPALAIWYQAPVKTIEDARKTEIVVGATGEGSSSYRYTAAMNHVLGTKFKIIKGYKTVPEVLLAIDRGEVQGRTGSLTAYEEGKPDWLKENKLTFLMQVGYTRDPDLKDVPLWTELAATAEDKQILNLIASPTNLGRPVNTTPGVPADRVAALREALLKMVKDPVFIAEAEKQDIETDFRGWEETSKIVADTVAAPPETVQKAIDAMK